MSTSSPVAISCSGSAGRRKLLEEIYEQFLVCKICFDVYSNPKTLSCLHTFCEQCIDQLLATELERSYRYVLYSPRAINCPICRKRTDLPTGGVRRLPDNLIVPRLIDMVSRGLRKSSNNNLMGSTPCDICESPSNGQPRQRSRRPSGGSTSPAGSTAVIKCLDCCKALCKNCTELHRRTKVTSEHSLVDVEVEDKDVVCKFHDGELVRYYCEQCSMCVCVVCAFESPHRGHDVVTFPVALTRHCHTLDSLIEACRARAERLRQQLDHAHSVEVDIKLAEEQVREAAIDWVTAVRRHEQALLAELRATFTDHPRMQSFVAERPAVESTMRALENACQLSDVIVRERSVELLLLKDDLTRRMTSLLQTTHPEPPDVDSTAANIRFVMTSSIDLKTDGFNFGRIEYGKPVYSSKMDVERRADGDGMDDVTSRKRSLDDDDDDDDDNNEGAASEKRFQSVFPPESPTVSEDGDVSMHAAEHGKATMKIFDVTEQRATAAALLKEAETSSDDFEAWCDDRFCLDRTTMTDSKAIMTDVVKTVDSETMTSRILLGRSSSGSRTRQVVSSSDPDTRTQWTTMNSDVHVEHKLIATMTPGTVDRSTLTTRADDNSSVFGPIAETRRETDGSDKNCPRQVPLLCDRSTMTVDGQSDVRNPTGVKMASNSATKYVSSQWRPVQPAGRGTGTVRNAATETEPPLTANKGVVTERPFQLDKMVSTLRTRLSNQQTNTPHVVYLDMGVDAARIPGEDKASATATIVTVDSFTSTDDRHVTSSTNGSGIAARRATIVSNSTPPPTPPAGWTSSKYRLPAKIPLSQHSHFSSSISSESIRSKIDRFSRKSASLDATLGGPPPSPQMTSSLQLPVRTNSSDPDAIDGDTIRHNLTRTKSLSDNISSAFVATKSDAAVEPVEQCCASVMTDPVNYVEVCVATGNPLQEVAANTDPVTLQSVAVLTSSAQRSDVETNTAVIELTESGTGGDTWLIDTAINTNDHWPMSYRVVGPNTASSAFVQGETETNFADSASTLLSKADSSPMATSSLNIKLHTSFSETSSLEGNTATMETDCCSGLSPTTEAVVDAAAVPTQALLSECNEPIFSRRWSNGASLEVRFESPRYNTEVAGATEPFAFREITTSTYSEDGASFRTEIALDDRPQTSTVWLDNDATNTYNRQASHLSSPSGERMDAIPPVSENCINTAKAATVATSLNTDPIELSEASTNTALMVSAAFGADGDEALASKIHLTTSTNTMLHHEAATNTPSRSHCSTESNTAEYVTSSTSTSGEQKATVDIRSVGSNTVLLIHAETSTPYTPRTDTDTNTSTSSSAEVGTNTVKSVYVQNFTNTAAYLDAETGTEIRNYADLATNTSLSENCETNTEHVDSQAVGTNTEQKIRHDRDTNTILLNSAGTNTTITVSNRAMIAAETITDLNGDCYRAADTNTDAPVVHSVMTNTSLSANVSTETEFSSGMANDFQKSTGTSTRLPAQTADVISLHPCLYCGCQPKLPTETVDCGIGDGIVTATEAGSGDFDVRTTDFGVGESLAQVNEVFTMTLSTMSVDKQTSTRRVHVIHRNEATESQSTAEVGTMPADDVTTAYLTAVAAHLSRPPTVSRGTSAPAAIVTADIETNTEPSPATAEVGTITAVDVTAAYRGMLGARGREHRVTVSRGTITKVTKSVDKDTVTDPRQDGVDRASSPVKFRGIDKAVLVNKASLSEPSETFVRAGGADGKKPASLPPRGTVPSVGGTTASGALRRQISGSCPRMDSICEGSDESESDGEYGKANALPARRRHLVTSLPSTPTLRRPALPLPQRPLSEDLQRRFQFPVERRTLTTLSPLARRRLERPAQSNTAFTESVASIQTESGISEEETSADVKRHQDRVEMSTNTSLVELRDQSTATDSSLMMPSTASVDGKMAECINKLKTVRQRLETQQSLVSSPPKIASPPAVRDPGRLLLTLHRKDSADNTTQECQTRDTVGHEQHDAQDQLRDDYITSLSSQSILTAATTLVLNSVEPLRQVSAHVDQQEVQDTEQNEQSSNKTAPQSPPIAIKRSPLRRPPVTPSSEPLDTNATGAFRPVRRQPATATPSHPSTGTSNCSPVLAQRQAAPAAADTAFTSTKKRYGVGGWGSPPPSPARRTPLTRGGSSNVGQLSPIRSRSSLAATGKAADETSAAAVGKVTMSPPLKQRSLVGAHPSPPVSRTRGRAPAATAASHVIERILQSTSSRSIIEEELTKSSSMSGSSNSSSPSELSGSGDDQDLSASLMAGVQAAGSAAQRNRQQHRLQLLHHQPRQRPSTAPSSASSSLVISNSGSGSDSPTAAASTAHPLGMRPSLARKQRLDVTQLLVSRAAAASTASAGVSTVASSVVPCDVTMATATKTQSSTGVRHSPAASRHVMPTGGHRQH